ncbi:related to Vacuolar protein-sorting-associated protein 24 [Saccharomycodes ludwigii]|uniref:Related to Vacuolar protein-sorting-associated protein 24 n=1 Tax=Saccharomycodes ludwigii TaxID=36035 RepID=A0A376B600_9ASCO|nr:hypothetical protein SCDLUD_004190 [Saccharomycodes ludwigii]KAH3899888.1 hypothetical protein SCDLUD_004190 [Saccharomycodes ludwigii]SSD60103.1 related to Vacuolar protein-sorting-associated protein 24 [Saccharomycodes ludwigii]
MDYIKKSIWGQQKPDPREQQRNLKKIIRKNSREVNRSLYELTNLKLKSEKLIKASAKKNDKKKVKIYCHELYRINKQYDRMYTSKAQLESIGLKVDEMLNLQKIGQTMAQGAGIMNEVNSLIHIPALRSSMIELEKELMKSGIITEMVDDTLEMNPEDDITVEEDDEEIENAVNEIMEKYTNEKFDKVHTVPQTKLPIHQQQESIPQKEKDEEDKIIPNENVDGEADNLLNEMRERLRALQS